MKSMVRLRNDPEPCQPAAAVGLWAALGYGGLCIAGNRIGIAQIEALDVEPLLARRQAFIEELRRVREERGLLQVILLLTDIGKKGSHVWFAGDRRDVLEQALGRPLTDDGTYIEGCMSRKKQVMPPLEQAFVNARETTASE